MTLSFPFGPMFVFACGVICAQSKSGSIATYLSPAEIASELKSAPNPKAAVIDRPVRVVDARGHNLGVAMVQRSSADANALVHDKIDEIYYVLEGGGTLISGGSLVNAKKTESSPTIGPGWSGASIEGGTSRKVGVGEVVIIPAGTPHMFTQLDGSAIRYLVYRIDPSQVLPLK